MKTHVAFRDGVAEWLVLKDPLYMARVVRDVRRNGTAYMVEETNGDQSRSWLAANTMDDAAEGFDELMQEVLQGRHKLLSLIDQKKQSENFYAELSATKVKELLGEGYSPLGEQWLQISGNDRPGAVYAWLVWSPWGKVWLSRMALLCIKQYRTKDFSPSDILDHAAISSRDLSQPEQNPDTNRHFWAQGDSTMKRESSIMDSGTPRKKFQDSATSMEAYSRFSNLSGLERYAVRGDGLFDGDNVAKTLGRAFFTGALTAPFGGVGGFLSGAGASLGSQYLDYMQYHKLATADKATRQCEDLYEVAKHIAAIAKSSKATGAAEAASDLVDAAMNFKQAVAAKFRNQEVQAQNLFSGNATEMRSRFKQPGVGFRPRSTRAAQTQPHLGTATEPEEKPLIDPSRVPENLALLGKNLLTSPGNVAGYAGAVVGPQLESKAEDLYNQWNPNPGRVEDMMNEAKNIMAEIRVLANESEHETGTTGLLEYVRSATNTMYSYMTRCLRAMQSQSKPASLNTDVVPNHMFLPGQNSVYPITG